MTKDVGMALGIDLGTTNSAVALMQEGEIRVLPNRLGETLTPSVVALDPDGGGLLVGRPAKEILALHPERAAAVFKRGMGREDAYRLGDADHGAIELSACVLRALAADAEAALGQRVDRCVVTVPAYFDEEQRFATMKAGELAGLDVLRILNEPTAAAMAYGLHERDKETSFLVFDLGGGTLDVCVMELFEGILQVRSTAGESRLGGEDFTRILAGVVLREVGLEMEQIEVQDREAFARLLRRCELAKRRLSVDEEVEIGIPAIEGSTKEDIAITMSRADAERAWEPLVDRMISPCRAALRGARMPARELEDVILVGGATRMPRVADLVRELFEREPLAVIDTDLAVVHGAAIQASLSIRDAAVEDIVVTDVISHSLGVDVAKAIGSRHVPGYFSPVIHRNTVIPTSRTESYQTLEPNQTRLVFGIYEGESRRVSENRKLGELEIKGLPRAPAGQEVSVTFTYDLNGLLEVEARVENTGKTLSKIFNRDAGNVSHAALEAARKRMAKLKEDPSRKPENRDLLLRAGLLWKESPPEMRTLLDAALEAFEAALAERNEADIAEAASHLSDLCDRIDGGERW